MQSGTSEAADAGPVRGIEGWVALGIKNETGSEGVGYGDERYGGGCLMMGSSRGRV